MRRRPVVRDVGPVTRLCLGVLAAMVGLGAAPAFGQAPLTVNGTLVIDVGGTNTSTVRYTELTVNTGSDPVTIRLSAAYPTLVIRGRALFAEACDVPGDCWDSDFCLEKTDTSAGACGWSGIELPPTCTNTNGAGPASALDRCASVRVRGQRDPTSFSGILADTDTCIWAATPIAALDASCPQQQYRDAYDRAVFDVIARSQREMQANAGRLVTADVYGHLKRIGDWYAAYRRLYPAAGGDSANELVWSQSSRVIGSFWKAAYEKVGVPLPGSSNPPDALLDSLFQNGLEADRTVLAAAFTSPLPIQTAPLVQVMGDALQSMSSRLAQVGLYHDLACRFRDVPDNGSLIRCANDQVKTEIAELIHLLAASADATDLSQVVARPAPATVTSIWVPWKSVFSALSTQHPPFEQAVLDALPGITTYTPDLIAPRPPQPGNPPPPPQRLTPPLTGLAKIVQEARVRSNSYFMTGLFDSRYAGVLRAGISESRVNEVISRAQTRTADLRAEVTNYSTTRLQLANAVLQEMTNLGSQQNVIDTVNERMAKERQLREDLAGIRTAIEVQEARYGDFMRAYNDVALIVASRPGTEITHLEANVTVTAGDARWLARTDPPAPTDLIGDFRSNAAGTRPGGPLTWPIVATKGDIINLNTSGVWSPSCALRTSQFENPLTNVTDQYNVPNPALTGPEGYLVTLTDGDFTAITNTSVHSVEQYTNEGKSRKYCGGASASVGGAIPIPGLPVSIGIGASGSAEYCRYRDSGTRTSDLTSHAESTGSERRMSAAFATGIRLPTTPFPMFPAGSLLLVQVARNGTLRSDIRDVQVVQKPFTSVVVSNDADFYFVVNDVVDPACTNPNTSALTVSVNQIRPFGAMAEQLGTGMANALANLRADQDLLIEQGRVGPQQMAALRDQAFADLVLACGASCSQISYYPGEVLKFFEAWVSKELAAIERKVDARTLEREIALIELQHLTLANDLRRLLEQARFLTLMPTWLLKDLGTYVMQSKSQNLLDLLIADLYPIVDLRQPATLRLIDPRMLNALLGMNVLLDPAPLDWTGNMKDWSNAAARASDHVIARLQDSLGNSQVLSDAIVLVGIPNPAVPPEPANWQRIPTERAQVVWDAIVAELPFVSVPIGPPDLYPMLAGSTNVLLCTESVPVITAMAVYMVRPYQFEQFPGLRVPVSIDRNLYFPDVGLLKNYRMVSDEYASSDQWLNMGARVLAGEYYEIWDKVDALMKDSATPLYRAGNGLSPFAQFDISLAGITNAPYGPAPADYASELVLAFRVASRMGSSIGLQPMCP